MLQLNKQLQQATLTTSTGTTKTLLPELSEDRIFELSAIKATNTIELD
jgi:hypothetical protein